MKFFYFLITHSFENHYSRIFFYNNDRQTNSLFQQYQEAAWMMKFGLVMGLVSKTRHSTKVYVGLLGLESNQKLTKISSKTIDGHD